MPAELLEPLVYFAAYWTGKPIVRVLSLGRLHVALLAEPDAKARRKQKWYSVTFVRDGKRYVDGEAVCVVGLIAWILAIAAITMIVSRW